MKNFSDRSIVGKIFYLFLMSAFCGVSLVSCDDSSMDYVSEPTPDPIVWDASPVTADIHLVGPDGENLLNPNTPGNWLGKDIWMEYDGKKQEAKWENPFHTREYMAFFYGLYLSFDYKLSEDGSSILVPDATTNFLQFGEFDGAENQDIKCTLHIEGQEKVYQIEMINKVTLKRKMPEITRVIKLDGNTMEDNKITITLPPYAD